MRRVCSLFPVAMLAVAAAGVALAVDFGDSRSETLTSKAWKALETQEFADALTYTDKCVELYAEKARQMQNALRELPANEPKDETSKRWALNDVGTCLFIRGQVLLKQGDKPGAKAAYARLVKEFKYAQCWDPKGWFWKPADAAKKSLVELELDDK